MFPRLKFHTQFTKSLKRDNIYLLCLWMPEEHNRLILTSYHLPKLKYTAHAKNVNLSYIVKHHSTMTILKYLVYR